MGAKSQKKKLFDGLPESQAKKKLLGIWAEVKPNQASFDSASEAFSKEYSITLLGLCEMWHRLRSRNDTVELMVQSFAHTVAEKNNQINRLSETIYLQRKRLAQFENRADAPVVVPE